MKNLVGVIVGMGGLLLLLGAQAAVIQESAVYIWPFESLEAETALTSGQVSEYNTAYYSLGSEASGRRYVSLNAPGQYVEWKPTQAYNSLVLRFCLPDGPDGKGTRATVRVTSPGFPPVEMELTSYYAWIYGDFPWTNNPQDGNGHKFFDEAATLLALRRAQVPLRVEVLRAEAYPVILDMADFEEVAAPLAQPKGFLNLRDFGALGDGKTNDTRALQQALRAAKEQGTGLFVPPGQYFIQTISLHGAHIQGAGMWHTRFVGPASRFNISGGLCVFKDFAVFGETVTRDDNSSRDLAFGGTPGPDSLLERVWVERKKCAFWVGNGGQTSVERLTIRECRFRNLMADAVNFCNGTSDSTVEKTHVRYSGDDGLATWSVSTDPPCRRNSFVNNFIALPWLANGIALYGGEDHRVIGNTVVDTIHTGSGVYLSANFKAAPFTGTHTVSGNTLIRCGTALSDQGGAAGALRLLAWDKNMDQARILIHDNVLIEPIRSAISIGGPRLVSGVEFRGNRVVNPGTYALELKDRSQGLALFENNTSEGGRGTSNKSGKKFRTQWVGTNPGFVDP